MNVVSLRRVYDFYDLSATFDNTFVLNSLVNRLFVLYISFSYFPLVTEIGAFAIDIAGFGSLYIYMSDVC